MMATVNEEMTRWTAMVSKNTDVTLRSYLAQHGQKKGAISKFIEDAVKWRVMELNLAEARDGFADMAEDDLQSLIDEATAGVRAEMFPTAAPKQND